MIYDIVIFVTLIFVGKFIFIGIKTRIFHFAHSEAMTVRKEEEPISYFFVFLLYTTIWLWLLYLLFK